MMNDGDNTPFANSPFGLTANEVAREFFPAAKRRTVNGIEIVSDLDVEPACTYSLEVEIERADNGKSASNAETSDFTVYVLLSRDKELLRKAYEQTRLDENEACLYMDVSRNRLDVDQPTWVRLGKRLREDPQALRETLLNQLSIAQSNDEKTERNADRTAVNFVNSLVNDGKQYFENRSWALLLFPFFGPIVRLPYHTAVGESLIWSANKLRKHLQIPQERWDPEAGTGQSSDDLLFSLPGFVEDQTYEEAQAAIKGKFDQGLKTFKKTFDELIGNDLETAIAKSDSANLASKGQFNSPSFLKQSNLAIKSLRTAVSRLLSNFRDTISAELEELWQSVSYLGKQYFIFLNAMIAGLINSIVDLVASVLQVVGFLFLALGQPWKMIRELLRKIANLNFTEIIKKIWDLVKRFNWTAFIEKISLARCGYFAGAIWAFLLELKIEAILTVLIPGSGIVAFVGNRMAKLFGDVGKTIAKTLGTVDFPQLPPRLSPRLLAEAGGKRFRVVLELLETEKILKLIDDAFQMLLDSFKLPIDKIEEFFKRFGRVDTETIETMQANGVFLTGLTEKSGRICKLLRN